MINAYKCMKIKKIESISVLLQRLDILSSNPREHCAIYFLTIVPGDFQYSNLGIKERQVHAF